MNSVVLAKLLAVEKELNGILQERSQPIRGIILSSLSKTNVLFLGSAGIAKSALVNQWNKRITGGQYFSWLLTKFTTPEEIFGPPSLKGLEEEKYYRVVKNKLPEATTAFLDEVFKANSSILNSMLTVLNERVFYNDGVPVPMKILTIAGASNEIPEAEDGLDAFFDRFLLKYFMKPIQESSNFTKMLSAENFDNATPKATITIDEILQAQNECENIPVSDVVIGHIVKLRDALRKEGVLVTDRTFKVSMRVLKAQAYLNGRDEVTTDDMEVFKSICWNKPDQEKKVHSLILELISPEKNKIVSLFQACQDVSKDVYKQKDAVKKQQALIEANKKIKDARVEIGKYKKDMITKKQDTKEVAEMEQQLEQILIAMATDVLGVNIASLTKD